MTIDRYNKIVGLLNAYLKRYGTLVPHFILMDMWDGKLEDRDREWQSEATRLLQETGVSSAEMVEWAEKKQNYLDVEPDDDVINPFDAFAEVVTVDENREGLDEDWGWEGTWN
jgi:hypothetical protein